MWKRSTLILVTISHKTFWLYICLIENNNLWTTLQSAITRKRDFPQPILPILSLISTTCSITSTIAYMVVSVFDRVLFRVLSDSVLFRVLSDRGLFSVLSDRAFFRILSNRILSRVLFRVFIDRILFRVLSARILSRILND